MFTDCNGCDRGGGGGRGKKLIEAAEWQSEYLPTCAACTNMYEGRVPPETPPCSDCMPQICEENREALMIFGLVRNQLIMGFGAAVDINHLAVWKAIEEYGIKEKRKVFERILRLSNWNINKMATNEIKTLES